MPHLIRHDRRTRSHRWPGGAPVGARRSVAAGTMSVALHAAVFIGLVAGSGPRLHYTPDRDIRPVFYLPPPIRPPSELASHERIHYVAVGLEGSGAGHGAAGAEDDGSGGARGADGRSPAEPGSAAPASAAAGDDPVFTMIEVDEAAVRMAGSAAPAYPEALLREGIEGSVVVQYVVDAAGFADPGSLRVLSASHREFADAVRAALPHMRFTPARIGSAPVRQLVEQPFSFRIQRPVQTQPDTIDHARTTPRAP